MAFVKCIFLWVPFWYPLAKVFFIFFDEYIWFACEKTYFPTKINQKCTLNKVSVIFFLGLHSRKNPHEEIKGFPLLIRWVLSCSCCQYEICVWFWSVENSGGSLQSYQWNYSDMGWCCVTGRNETGGRRDVSLQLTSAVSFCLSLWQFIRWQLNFSLWWENIWVCEALNCINASRAQCLFQFPLI